MQMHLRMLVRGFERVHVCCKVFTVNRISTHKLSGSMHLSSDRVANAEEKSNTSTEVVGKKSRNDKYVGNCEVAILGSKENKGRGETSRPVFNPKLLEPEDIKDIEAPTNCCMSGCPNCVWIDYAEALIEAYSNSALGKERLKQELNNLQDQNIKAFIMLELRTRGIL